MSLELFSKAFGKFFHSYPSNSHSLPLSKPPLDLWRQTMLIGNMEIWGSCPYTVSQNSNNWIWIKYAHVI